MKDRKLKQVLTGDWNQCGREYKERMKEGEYGV
jgi:hypothetical protein